jgi:hypothetical protein
MPQRECEESLTLQECARVLNVGRSTAWRMFAREPGVERLTTPGACRPIIRIPRSVLDRVRRRSKVDQR